MESGHPYIYIVGIGFVFVIVTSAMEITFLSWLNFQLFGSRHWNKKSFKFWVIWIWIQKFFAHLCEILYCHSLDVSTVMPLTSVISQFQ